MEPLAPCQRKNPYPSPYSLPAGVGGTREQCLCGRWWQPPDPYAVDRVGGAVGHSSSSAGGKGRGAGFHPTSAVEVEPTEGLEPGGAAEPQPERAESLAQIGPRAAGTEAGGWRRCNCSPQSRQDSVRSVNKYEPRALGGGGVLTVEHDGLQATWQGGGDVIAVCTPRATREDAGRTEPGALLLQLQRKEKSSSNR